MSATGLREQAIEQVNKLGNWFGFKEQGLGTKLDIKGQRVMDTAKLNWDIRQNPHASELPALNQYGNAANESVILPSFGAKPDAGYDVGKGERAVAYAARHPIYAGAGLMGGIIADQIVGKPVEGLVDAVTFNALNLRPDETYRAVTDPYGGQNGMPYAPPQPMPSPYNSPIHTAQPNDLPPQIPPLSAEDISREVQRQQKNMAVSSITVAELQRMQQQQANNPYQQS